MKIGIHSNQFDGRGTGKTPYDYGIALKNILGHEVVYITSSLSKNEGLERISKEFQVVMYPEKADVSPPNKVRYCIEQIVEQHRVEFVQMLKYGNNDGVTPSNCRTGVHCVFSMNEPHGDVYAAVSNNLAKKFNQVNYVPHIITGSTPNKNIRKELNIPEDALVVGRHGGYDTFDLQFVYQAIQNVLDIRKDVYFLFLSTRPFITHERVIFFPWVSNERGIHNFIHSCDIMLHARHMGETFGLSVGEFAACNKPVMTWSGLGQSSYDTAHIEQLDGKAIIYNYTEDLTQIINNLDVSYLRSYNWDTFTEKFSPYNVIKQYERVFLK